MVHLIVLLYFLQLLIVSQDRVRQILDKLPDQRTVSDVNILMQDMQRLPIFAQQVPPLTLMCHLPEPPSHLLS